MNSVSFIKTEPCARKSSKSVTILETLPMEDQTLLHSVALDVFLQEMGRSLTDYKSIWLEYKH